jgi:hypothetical protein
MAFYPGTQFDEAAVERLQAIADATGTSVCLHSGQIVKKYHLLDEKAKQAARRAWLDNCGPHHDWFMDVFEWVNEIAGDLGIEIDRRGPHSPQIFFSGFWSQGDGASYTGNWYYRSGARQAVAHLDDEVQRIAAELFDASRRSFWQTSARITTSGRYSHSGSMNIQVFVERGAAVEKQVAQALRDFADWIYTQLQNEYEYLTSETAIDEQLADQWFFEDGELTS